MEWADEEKVRVSLLEKDSTCNHFFHSGCIHRWIDVTIKRDLSAVPNCPICREAIGPQNLLKFQQWKVKQQAKAEKTKACERRTECMKEMCVRVSEILVFMYILLLLQHFANHSRPVRIVLY